ncbi:DUF885 family protein [Paenibacillus humicola]|uniref:DUF885 family protein n=1 Tax=Paenibacillus humicola TaxID=3110540 RepID=UPI00237BE568|nr:DUF885 family protein [Paenibacillus humicola]
MQKLDQRVTDLFVRYDGHLDFENKPFIPELDHFGELAEEIAAAQHELRLEEKTGLPPETAVVLDHLAESAGVLKARLQTDQSFPNRFISNIARRINNLISLKGRGPAERLSALREFLGRTPAVFEGVRKLGDRIPGGRREILLRTLGDLPGFSDKMLPGLVKAFPSASEEELGAVRLAFKELSGRAMDLAAEIRQAPLPEPAACINGLDYENTLGQVYGISLTELLTWYREEVEQCRQRFYEVAGELDSGRDAFRILDEDLGPYDSPEKVLPAMEGFVAAARAKAREYMSLPEGEDCAVWPVPEYLRDSYPWGGYFSGGNLLTGSLRGAVFLNVHNYRTLSLGWILLNAVHECYPGHHAHFVKTAAGDMPRSFKVASLTSQAAALNEGLCIRSETLMQDIFGRPAFRLFVAFRRLHAAVRIWADLLVHHFGEGPDAAVDLYVKYMQFTPQVARGQVYSQELTPGYFTTYYYGFKRLERLQRELGWDDAAFTGQAFSCGKVSLNILERLLRMTSAQRFKIVNGFYAGPEQKI